MARAFRKGQLCWNSASRAQRMRVRARIRACFWGLGVPFEQSGLYAYCRRLDEQAQRSYGLGIGRSSADKARFRLGDLLVRPCGAQVWQSREGGKVGARVLSLRSRAGGMWPPFSRIPLGGSHRNLAQLLRRNETDGLRSGAISSAPFVGHVCRSLLGLALPDSRGANFLRPGERGKGGVSSEKEPKGGRAIQLLGTRGKVSEENTAWRDCAEVGMLWLAALCFFAQSIKSGFGEELGHRVPLGR